MFQRKELVGKLLSQYFNGKTPRHDQFLKSVKTVRNDMFEPGAVLNKVVGPICALCLQLVVNGTVELVVSDQCKSSIGVNKLEAKHDVVKCSVLSEGLLAYLDNAKWMGMTFVDGVSNATIMIHRTSQLNTQQKDQNCLLPMNRCLSVRMLLIYYLYFYEVCSICEKNR